MRTACNVAHQTVLAFLAAALLLSLLTVPKFDLSAVFVDSSAVYRYGSLKVGNTVFLSGAWWTSRAMESSSVSINDNLDGGQTVTVHREPHQEYTQGTSLRRRRLYANHQGDKDFAGSLLGVLVCALLLVVLAWMSCQQGFESLSLDALRERNRQWVSEEPTFPAVISPSTQAGDCWNSEKAGWKLPSGMLWEGYFKQYWWEHKLPAFQLESAPMQDSSSSSFSSSLPQVEQLTGSGSDKVGPYELSGIWRPTTGRMSFTKTYTRSTGVFSPNGHAVEYRGTMISPPQSSLPQKASESSTAVQIIGTWSLPAGEYNETGSFTFWPADRATTTPSYHQPMLSSGTLQEDSGKDVPLLSKDACNHPSIELT